MSPEVNDQRVLEQSILRTVLYSDLFDYALTPDEVAHYLIGISSSAERIRTSLAAPIWLDGQISRVDGYITTHGRETLVARRASRTGSSQRLWRRARRFVRVLGILPFVRMVGVTGALAMDNSDDDDDIDVLIVTVPGRVWLTRGLVVLLVHFGKLLGDTLCPNYVISENALVLEDRTVFVAHEFVQMVPVYGLTVYRRMQAANSWIASILPNATQPYRTVPEYRLGLAGRALKRIAERLLSGRIGDRLEAWEMNRKILKFRSRLRLSGGSAILDRDHVKGHFDDYAIPITRRYRRRLQEFDLSDQAMQL